MFEDVLVGVVYNGREVEAADRSSDSYDNIERP